MDDFTPDGIIDYVPEILELNDVRELLEYLRDGGRDPDSVESYLEPMEQRDHVVGLLESNGVDLGNLDILDGDSIGYMLVELDRRIGNQLDEILHHDAFARLEASWRSLKFLVERTNTNENCSVDILNVSKESLIEDFEDVPEITNSILYDIVYSSAFGQFGGRPYGVIVGDYEFGPNPQDIKLAQQIAAIAKMSHAPFIAGADAGMFDIDGYSGLSRLRDFNAIFEQGKFAKWNSFRESEDARYFALSLPRFRLRSLYSAEGNDGNSLGYRESVTKGAALGVWGNSAFAFVSRLVDSFAKYRWCINITGEEDGKVDGLTMEKSDGATNSLRIPTEVLISERQERELVNQGFIPLSIHKGNDTAAFFSSNSVIAGKTFSNDLKGREASLSHHMSSQLQYLFITCRIAHYLKMMQREHIGSWKNQAEVSHELNDWIRQYVSDMDNPTASIRARRPLRRARIDVNDLEDRSDWYVIDILITPHLKYMGNSFTLEETGKLDKY
jgi:type VI secretion system protein ImpC